MNQPEAILRDAQTAIDLHTLEDKGRFGEDGLDIDTAVKIIEILRDQLVKALSSVGNPSPLPLVCDCGAQLAGLSALGRYGCSACGEPFRAQKGVETDTAIGEEVCRRCGGPNLPWAAPSPLWNAVMRGGSINGSDEFDGIVCPTCFVALAEERGIACGWWVEAETVTAELESVTPNGRVWDPVARCWAEPGCTEPDTVKLVEALKVAADDLDKAANQFEAMRQSQEAGHVVPISINSRRFAEKADRVRDALVGFSVDSRKPEEER